MKLPRLFGERTQPVPFVPLLPPAPAKKKRKWKPKTGETYFMFNSRIQIQQTKLSDGVKSKARIKAGNCFKTRKEAEAVLSQIKEIL